MHLLPFLSLVLLLSGGCFCGLNPPNDVVDLEQVFDPTDAEAGYQRRYTIDVPHKTEDCFFLPDIKEKQVLNYHFMVLNVGRNGRKMDITSRIRGPDKKIVNFQSRKSEGKLIGQELTLEGDYEICFNNRYSMLESKRVFWQFEIEGQVDEVKEEKQIIEDSSSEYLETSKMVKQALGKVRTKVSRIKHQKWRKESLLKKDQARMESLREMIQTWSIVHVLGIIIIGLAQVYFLRRFFNTKSSPHYIRVGA